MIVGLCINTHQTLLLLYGAQHNNTHQILLLLYSAKHITTDQILLLLHGHNISSSKCYA